MGMPRRCRPGCDGSGGGRVVVGGYGGVQATKENGNEEMDERVDGRTGRTGSRDL